MSSILSQTICMTCHCQFSEKIIKNITTSTSNLLSAEFLWRNLTPFISEVLTLCESCRILSLTFEGWALWVKNLADDILNYFSYFSQKKGFDISCSLWPICMKCQSLFSGGKKKRIFFHNVILLKFLHRVLSIDWDWCGIDLYVIWWQSSFPDIVLWLQKQGCKNIIQFL